MVLLYDALIAVLIILKTKIFGSYFWVVSSWYQSPGLRDSDTLSGVSELKLRGNKRFLIKCFYKRILKTLRRKRIVLRKRCVHAVNRAQVSTPKLPIQVICSISV